MVSETILPLRRLLIINLLSSSLTTVSKAYAFRVRNHVFAQERGESVVEQKQRGWGIASPPSSDSERSSPDDYSPLQKLRS